MNDDEILAGFMRRVLARGTRLTIYSDRGLTVTLDDSPYSVTREEIEAMQRATKASQVDA